MTPDLPFNTAPPPLPAPPMWERPTDSWEFAEVVSELRQALKDIDDLKLRIELLEPIPPVKKRQPSALERAFAGEVKNPATRSLFAGNCFIKRASNDEVVIGCLSEPLANMLKQPAKMQALRDATDTVISSEAKIVLVVEKQA